MNSTGNPAPHPFNEHPHHAVLFRKAARPTEDVLLFVEGAPYTSNEPLCLLAWRGVKIKVHPQCPQGCARRLNLDALAIDVDVVSTLVVLGSNHCRLVGSQGQPNFAESIRKQLYIAPNQSRFTTPYKDVVLVGAQAGRSTSSPRGAHHSPDVRTEVAI